MYHSHHEIRIDAPVDHVWAFYCDTSRWPDWMAGGEFSDFTGPIDMAGTTYVQSMRLMGFEMKSTCTVVEVEPPRLYHEHSDMGSMEAYLRFEPDGEGTRVAYDMDYEMPGHLPGFITDLMAKGWGERQASHMLANFKSLAEATVRVPA
jgi:uncharacterized membrane protein